MKNNTIQLKIEKLENRIKEQEQEIELLRKNTKKNSLWIKYFILKEEV
jgi:hypothetical protein